MATNFGGVERGMDVYDSAGEKIGDVADVLTLAAFSDRAQSHSNPGTAPVTDKNSVLKVNEGGLLGIGATELYIPLDAIQTITPGESVTLNCVKAQCDALYAKKPSFLDNA